MSRLKRAGEKEIDELDHREVLKVVNPAGGEMLASISSATEEDVKKYQMDPDINELLDFSFCGE